MFDCATGSTGCFAVMWYELGLIIFATVCVMILPIAYLMYTNSDQRKSFTTAKGLIVASEGRAEIDKKSYEDVIKKSQSKIAELEMQNVVFRKTLEEVFDEQEKHLSGGLT